MPGISPQEVVNRFSRMGVADVKSALVGDSGLAPQSGWRDSTSGSALVAYTPATGPEALIINGNGGGLRLNLTFERTEIKLLKFSLRPIRR